MNNNSPNFFVVGAAKAGTTSLYNYLAEHPEIYLSPVKEPNYFSIDIDPSKFRDDYDELVDFELEPYLNGPMNETIHIAFVHDEGLYKKLFKNVKNEIAIGEASNSYLYSRVAAERIREIVPNSKIIMMLRNPITRAFSHYLMNVGSQYKQISFKEELENDLKKNTKGWGISHIYLELGSYHEQVKRYIDNFPPENVGIYIYEDYQKNPRKTVTDIYKFLGVSTHFKPDLSKKYNVSLPRKKLKESFSLSIESLKRFSVTKLPKYLQTAVTLSIGRNLQKPRIDEESLHFLKNYYAEDIKKLSLLINKDLTMWLKI